MNREKHITQHPATVTRERRERRNGHIGRVIWLTGLSGAGKSTLAHALEERLFSRGWQTFTLDGDSVRHGLNSDLGFTAAERDENIRRVGEVARLFADAGMVVIVAFISPFRAARERARSLFEPGRFLEVHVRCPLPVCEERDTKGLYEKARQGLIPDFTGISSPYEEPLDPELVIDTDLLSVEQSVELVLSRLDETGK